MTHEKFITGLCKIQELQLMCSPAKVKTFKISLHNFEEEPILPFVVVAVLKQGPGEDYRFFRFYSENSEEQWKHTFKLLRDYV